MLLVLVVLVVLARGLHPVSFPNLEVKPFCADGTATGRLWESRALPTVFLWWGCLVLFEGRHPHHSFLFYQPGPGVVVGKEGLRVKMCVWLGVSRGLDLAFLNAD